MKVYLLKSVRDLLSKFLGSGDMREGSYLWVGPKGLGLGKLTILE